MADRLTQCEEILEYMNEKGSITPMDAMHEIGCMRLASRICDLKKQGYHISKEMVNYVNFKGIRKRYASYRLED